MHYYILKDFKNNRMWHITYDSHSQAVEALQKLRFQNKSEWEIEEHDLRQSKNEFE